MCFLDTFPFSHIKPEELSEVQNVFSFFLVIEKGDTPHSHILNYQL